MSSTEVADGTPLKSQDPSSVVNEKAEDIGSNNDAPAQTIAEDNTTDPAHKDDPATAAASEELRHASISDKARPELEIPLSRDDVTLPVKERTPRLDAIDTKDEEMSERLASPKKKRLRDQDEDVQDLEGDEGNESGSTADGNTVNGGRTVRLGPEKKRHRDTSKITSKATGDAAEAKKAPTLDSSETGKTSTPSLQPSTTLSQPSSQPTTANTSRDKPQTASSAFTPSGFGSPAGSSTSPFGTLGSSKPSVFGGNAQPSGFGALSSNKSPPGPAIGLGNSSGDKQATGFGSGFGGTTTSGFGSLGSGSVFGSALGNGFAGGTGPKLSSFAAPGKENTRLPSKPAKPFGAPESDEEEEEEDDDDSDAGADSEDEDGEKPTIEEKKKTKTTKVQIDDGEAGEATLIQLRAKLFALESKEAGWKERGVGTLKINVPKGCAEYDEITGLPHPGSFDKSGVDEEDESAPQAPRLIMRQENTHRVILNTIILPAMEFKDKPATTAAQILFTAFEGEKDPKPINMLFKLSETNARLFRNEIASIQQELSS